MTLDQTAGRLAMGPRPFGIATALLAMLSVVPAHASSCGAAWELATLNHIATREMLERLGDARWRELMTVVYQDQWRTQLLATQILIEATPVRIVDIRNANPNAPFRRVIEFRDVRWLRDLRVGARRPSRVAIGITYSGCEGCTTTVAKDRVVAWDRDKLLLPGDPAIRYLIGLTIARTHRPRAGGCSPAP